MYFDMGEGMDAGHPPVKDKVSKAEWDARVELAAFFRLIEHFGYNSSPGNHITARVPDQPDHFLINPGNRMFGEVTATSLVKIDMEGNLKSPAPTGIVNPAGHVIHSAVFMARPEVMATCHLHTTPGIAVSVQKSGFKFYSQESLRFYGRIGYHDYEGIARDYDERETLAHDLKDNMCLVLRNHGSLLVGRSIAECFQLTISYEKSCAIQVAAEASGDELHLPSEEACQRTSRIANRNRPPGTDAWTAYRRIADRHYPTYKN